MLLAHAWLIWRLQSPGLIYRMFCVVRRLYSATQCLSNPNNRQRIAGIFRCQLAQGYPEGLRSSLVILVLVNLPLSPLANSLSDTLAISQGEQGQEIDVKLAGQIGGSTNAMAVEGNRAYVGVGPRLVILDVSEPWQPTFLGQTGVLPGIVRGLTYRHLWTDRDAGPLAGIGHTFEVTPYYVETSERAYLAPGTTYTVTLQYDETERGPVVEDTLAFYWWDGSRWLKEPSSVVDSGRNTLTATPDYLSLWAVLGKTRRTYLPLMLRAAA